MSERLPEGWKWVRLGEVCEVSQYGLTATAIQNRGFPYIRISDIDDFGNISLTLSNVMSIFNCRIEFG